MSGHTVQVTDPDGLTCMDCPKALPHGSYAYEVIEGFDYDDGMPVTTLVCRDCYEKRTA